MGRINVLDKNTSEKIAAGEVVERPASVIKELVENAIDAGASAITVEIKHGGSTYMRVTDNGCGMSREDAKIAFLRHATSKIKTIKDLENILTLGFRGEALCSIAAVSRTELFTKQRTDDEATHILVEGGTEILCEGAGSPDGTTIVVKDLFFNTPARMKFMKKDSVEAAAILDVCNKQALSHSDVSMRVIRDGKEVLFSPGDNVLKNCVHAVFGKDVASSMTEVNFSKNGVKVFGLTGKNNLSRPNRLMQIFFINGRYVVNKVLATALSEAYKNELMIGRFPAAVLFIELDASLVDVNVHPGKTEVKFASDQNIYEAVYWAVKNALAKESGAREVKLPQTNKAFEMPFNATKSVQLEFSSSKATSKFKPFTPQAPVKLQKQPTLNEIREAVKPYEGKLPVREIESIKPTEKPPVPEKTVVKEELPVQPTQKEAPVIKDYRIIGQLFSTYILTEQNGEFILTDQHAAHERINYEKLKEAGKAPHQMLLVPISLNLTPEEKSLCEENAAFFSDMGFEIEDFGQNAIVLRAIPADCPYEDGGDLLIELLNIFSKGEGGEVLSMRDKAIYSVACHLSVRANQNLSMAEMEKIYLQACELEGISTCPHGRPISIKLTKYQIEKMFGRIV